MTNNYIHYEVWDEITSPLPNINATAVEFGKKSVISPQYLSLQGLKLILISKTAHVNYYQRVMMKTTGT